MKEFSFRFYSYMNILIVNRPERLYSGNGVRLEINVCSSCVHLDFFSSRFKLLAASVNEPVSEVCAYVRVYANRILFAWIQ